MFNSFGDPMDGSLSGSSVHGISQAKYWSGLPFPSPVDLPNPGIEPTSPALQANSLSLAKLNALESEHRVLSCHM